MMSMGSSMDATVANMKRRFFEPARGNKGAFIMAMLILVLGFYLIYPMVLILAMTFNVSADPLYGPTVWGLDNWATAFDRPGMWIALGNTFLVWGLTVLISFPTAILISWTLARANIPGSQWLELGFWVSFMLPGISTTIAWVALLAPNFGMLNVFLEHLPFFEKGPFNIFSIAGIVWVGLMGNGISFKVMLLTPAFRNMDLAMEEAARVSGASTVMTMLRITIPLMATPIVIVFALQMLRIFQSFETEFILGAPFGFFVYSTFIFDLIRQEVPQYGQATVLASATLVMIAAIIPIQRWVMQRRKYMTLSGSFKPGLIDIGPMKHVALFGIVILLVALTLLPTATLILQSFQVRAGYFNIDPAFTLDHWWEVLTDQVFLSALGTTLLLAFIAAIFSPLLFSFLAYTLVRTRWPGRYVLDMIIWGSAAIPGIISGLGLLWLFLGTPGLSMLYGTVYALLLVVIIQGNTTGVNLSKGTFVQVGADMEESARICGAGWFRTYIRIWIPLLANTLVLLGILNFLIAATTTSSIILLATAETQTLSIMALELASPEVGRWEQAGVVSLILLLISVGVAIVARSFGVRLGVQHT